MARMYRRAESTEFEVVDQWEAGFGWYAHPAEKGARTSHAIRGTDGVRLVDPIDAPGIADRIADLGEVSRICVLAEYHARDAAVFARRYDVPVTVPRWIGNVTRKLDAPVERTTGPIGGFELRRIRPLRAWRECIAYRERDRTLYVPDYLSGHGKFRVGDERLGMPTFSRLFPPNAQFADLAPARILFGHGPGIFEDATGALDDTLAGARRRFPRALISNLPGEFRAMFGALRN